MTTLNPCNKDKCGGIPYVSPYFDEERGVCIDDGMYTVRCYACGTIVSIEYSEEEAIEMWNLRNQGYKIKDNYIRERLFILAQEEQFEKNFGRVP